MNLTFVQGFFVGWGAATLLLLVLHEVLRAYLDDGR
jgi:hypothetical protein